MFLLHATEAEETKKQLCYTLAQAHTLPKLINGHVQPQELPGRILT